MVTTLLQAWIDALANGTHVESIVLHKPLKNFQKKTSEYLDEISQTNM